jgi:hypothetical protein
MIKSKGMKFARHEARMEDMKHSYNILVGIPEWKTQFGRPIRRWADNIRMDLKDIGWDDADCIHLNHSNQLLALVNTVMNHRIP